MIRIEEVNDPKKLEIYRDPWNKLIFDSETGDIFHTYEWIATWLDAFWKQRPIAFLLAWKKKELVGLAPFLIDPQGELGCPRSLVTPINGQSRRAGIVVSEERIDVLNAFFEHIRKNYRSWRHIFKDILSSSPIRNGWKSTAKRFSYLAMTTKKSSSPILKLEGGWQSYLNSRSKSTRRAIQKKPKKLVQTGRVDCLIVEDLSQWNEAMEYILVVESRSWKEIRGTSFHADPSLEEFYRNLGEKLARKGWLRTFTLIFQNRPIAHIYGCVFKNEYYALKTSYDEHYRKLSPGFVLFLYAIKDAFTKRRSVIDFLGGEDRWKRSLAPDSRDHVQLCTFPRSDLKCIFCKIRNNGIKPFVRKHFPQRILKELRTQF